jgi:threonine synthase
MQPATPLEFRDAIYFKREDCNLTGSVKDRSIQVQIAMAKNDGFRRFVLSSSGNAAISAAYFCKKQALNLDIFVSPHINPAKLAKIKEAQYEVHITPSPLESSIQFAEENSAFHLRQATSTAAVEGYWALAAELVAQIPKLAKSEHQQVGIFLPVSSGTTLVGIYQGLESLISSNQLTIIPEFHAVQTAAIHPIASVFDQNFKRKSSSLADAIVPPIDPPRKDEVVSILNQTEGYGWVISDSEIRLADQWLGEHQITTSYEGALALAGYFKFQKETGRRYDMPIIFLTGTKYYHE